MDFLHVKKEYHRRETIIEKDRVCITEEHYKEEISAEVRLVSSKRIFVTRRSNDILSAMKFSGDFERDCEQRALPSSVGLFGHREEPLSVALELNLSSLRGLRDILRSEAPLDVDVDDLPRALLVRASLVRRHFPHLSGLFEQFNRITLSSLRYYKSDHLKNKTELLCEKFSQEHQDLLRPERHAELLDYGKKFDSFSALLTERWSRAGGFPDGSGYKTFIRDGMKDWPRPDELSAAKDTMFDKCFCKRSTKSLLRFPQTAGFTAEQILMLQEDESAHYIYTDLWKAYHHFETGSFEIFQSFFVSVHTILRMTDCCKKNLPMPSAVLKEVVGYSPMFPTFFSMFPDTWNKSSYLQNWITANISIDDGPFRTISLPAAFFLHLFSEDTLSTVVPFIMREVQAEVDGTGRDTPKISVAAGPGGVMMDLPQHLVDYVEEFQWIPEPSSKSIK